MILEIYVLVHLFCPKFQVANLIIKFAFADKIKYLLLSNIIEIEGYFSTFLKSNCILELIFLLIYGHQVSEPTGKRF